MLYFVMVREVEVFCSVMKAGPSEILLRLCNPELSVGGESGAVGVTACGGSAIHTHPFIGRFPACLTRHTLTHARTLGPACKP